MAACWAMPVVLRALLVAGAALIPLGCGDSAEKADGFVVGTPEEGGVSEDAAVPDAAGADAGMDAAVAPPAVGILDAGPIDEPDTGPPPVDPCPIYCERALANCTGANALYPDEASCLEACAPMPPGEEGDTDVNSAWCRAHHADEAATAPDPHCGIASENGDGVCGPPCEAYCDQILAHCIDDHEQFADRLECMNACSAYPDGSWYDTTGDTVQCRIFHASFSALDDPVVHCAAAGVSGFGSCF